MFFLIAAGCFGAKGIPGDENDSERWELLSINPRNKEEVAKWNEDIILTITTGKTLSQSEYLNRELSLQKKTKLYRKILESVSANINDASTALNQTNQDLRNGINLSCFVGAVLLPEMAIALKEGNTSVFSERFKQILYILPVTDTGYSFVITPLLNLIPQGAYYSNDIINDNTKLVDRLLEKCQKVLDRNKNIPAKRLYFIRKNIVSLETLRMNLILMKFYQQNQRWPAEKEAKAFPRRFAERIDYHESDGYFSYQLSFPTLKMTSKASVMPREENTDIIIKKAKEWVPFKIILSEDISKELKAPQEK